MTVVVGVDPSARKIAFVVTDTVLGVSRVFAYPLYKTGSQTPESLGKAVGAVRDFLGHVEPMTRGGDKAAWVETPLVGGKSANVASATKQAYVRGIIVGLLVEAGFETHDVHQSTWKAWLGVTPNNREKKTTKQLKSEIALALSVRDPKLHRLCGGDVDLVDAGAIALYGCSQVTPASSPVDRVARPTRRRMQVPDGR